MKFSEKLRKAMKELNLTQTQMVGLIGKSKASISQYLSDKQVPSEAKQRDIAVALGLEEDYFSKLDDRMSALPTQKRKECIIPRLSVMDAARMMGINHQTVRKGLQQGVFPWGYGIKTSEHWVYFINAKRFSEIEGISVEGVANESIR
ncbi:MULTISPECIES: helix-turn-helix domain-containing protein [Clostridia]|uniref:Helix-turn-helix domain n=2 Tax=root TaxID=1 RepID=A0A174B0Z1_9FIRM|nr:helix-turn-helix transcriptional regulator [Fusicatenibacter saccharivorans]CUN93899.1 Helix-turn-helix domain [Fusicatenibacter saccharivorans]DAD75066.1 MAG TPA: helix-turn-helix domain protein [Siphoviridae sp. ctEEM24]